MNKTIFGFATALALAFFVVGCSSSPSKDELNQLKTMQAEIASLKEKAGNLKAEKASLQKAIDNAKAKLKTCQDHQAAVTSRLNGMK